MNDRIHPDRTRSNTRLAVALGIMALLIMGGYMILQGSG